MNPATLATAKMMNGTAIPPIPINAMGSLSGLPPSRSISLNHASFSFSLRIFLFGPPFPPARVTTAMRLAPPIVGLVRVTRV